MVLLQIFVISSVLIGQALCADYIGVKTLNETLEHQKGESVRYSQELPNSTEPSSNGNVSGRNGVTFRGSPTTRIVLNWPPATPGPFNNGAPIAVKIVGIIVGLVVLLIILFCCKRLCTNGVAPPRYIIRERIASRTVDRTPLYATSVATSSRGFGGIGYNIQARVNIGTSNMVPHMPPRYPVFLDARNDNIPIGVPDRPPEYTTIHHSSTLVYDPSAPILPESPPPDYDYPLKR